jgi:alkanesulfonate monooxygenase SsuD/methylene tetrahydromethanopterin reductase-like flavin-dependent oxidoreductase (luciferase family)
VGRDYDEILKTKLGHLVIAEDGEEARSIALGEGYPPEMLENYVIYGTPARIKERIIELQDAGVEYLIVNIHAKKEEAMLELFAEEVVKSFS